MLQGRQLRITLIVFVLVTAAFSVMAEEAGGEPWVDLGPAEELTITATRTYKRLKDTPVLTEVIRAEELKNSSAVTVTDALTQYGLVFSEDSTGTAYIQMQGLGETRVLLLIDGRRVPGRYSRRLVGETLPLANVEHIEIVRGPQSALYGSDALGGVINIITKKPRGASFQAALTNRFLLAHNDRETDAAPSPFDNVDPVQEQLFTADVSLPLGNAAATLDIEAARGGFYWNEDRSASVQPEYYRGRAGLAAVVDFGGDAALEAGGSALFLQRDNQTSPEGDLNRSGFLRAEGYGVFTRMAEAGRFSVMLSDSYYARNRDNYRAAPDTWTEGASFDRENLATIEISGDFYGFDAFIVNGGLEASFNSMEKSNLSEGFVFRDREAVFFQAEWYKEDVFSAVGGLRIERDSRFGIAAAPKLSVMRHLGGHFRLLGGAGLGYRAPDFTDLYMDANSSESHRVSGNENLEPELALSFNTAVEYAAPGGFIMVNGYYTELWGEVVNMPVEVVDDRQYYQRQNKNRTLRLGVDAEARVDLPLNLFASAGYGWLFAWDRTAAETIYPQPAHTVTGKLGVNVKKYGWYAHLAGRFFSPAVDDEYPESRFMLDLYGSAALSKNWTVNLAVDNITGEMLTTRMASVNAPRFSLGLSCSF